jgi:protocatechuate 3,4-dioxygenase beta subunit
MLYSKRGPLVFAAVFLVGVLAARAGAAPGTVTFSGTVVDAQGQPVGGAAVTVNLWDPPRSWRDWERKPVLQRTTAGADGSFRIPVAVRGEHWKAVVVAMRDGHGPGSQVVASSGAAEGFRITLTRPQALAGRVVNRGGQGVAGARVSVLWASAATIDDFLPLEGVLPPVASDAEGRFRLGPIPAGASAVLSVEHPQYARGTRSEILAAGREDVVLALTPPGSVAGRVVDESGQPAANVTVYCYQWHRLLLQATTDAGGRFRFANLAGGHYILRGERPAPAADPITNLEGVLLPEGGEGACPELRLMRGGTVMGSVQDDQGRPIVGAAIAAEEELLLPGRMMLRGQGALGTSGADGSYRLRLPPGKWRLYPQSSPPGTISELDRDINGDKYPEFVIEAGQSTRANFTLHTAAVLRGKVLGADGTVAASAKVRATKGDLIETIRTDAAGRFAVAGLLPGEGVGLIVFSRDGAQGARLELKPDAPDGEQTVRLQRLPAVSGVVLDSKGAPVAEAWVGAQQLFRSGRRTTIQSVNIRTSDAAGRFTLALFPDGQYQLSAGAPGFGATDPVTVEVAGPNTKPAPLRFSLERADGFVAGTVVDHDGKPLAGASVMVERSRGTMSAAIVGQTMTDSAGRFRVGGLPPGEVRLSPGLAGYRGGIRQTVPVGTAEARLILAPTADPAPAPGALKVGALAPGLQVARWINGAGIRGLDEARGKVVVLFFSAAFSPAAKEWNATLKALYARLKAEGRQDVLLLGLYDASVGAEDAAAYVTAEALPFPVGLAEPTRNLGADSVVFRAYGIRRLPTVVVIGTGGLLRAVDAAPGELAALVAKAEGK